MATDTESMHDNMTRLRMKMVRQKIANEREKLQRPQSQASDNGKDEQIKLHKAELRRQELLDQIQREQIAEGRPRTRTHRKRLSASSLSRRSLPDIKNKYYHFGYHGNNPDMAQVKHVVEHQLRPTQPAIGQGFTHLPAIQPFSTVVTPFATVQPLAVVPHPMTPAEVVPIQAIQPTYTWPALAIRRSNPKKDSMFNKGDFMDMMMLQNAQMHHMTMQQLMLHQLPGGTRPWSIPIAEPAAPVALVRPTPSVYHHHISQPNYSMPPMDYRGGGGGGGPMYGRNYNSTIYDDGSNYYHYH